MWDCIREKVQHLLDRERIKYPQEYPIRQEEVRGVIRLHGRGEGHDRRPAEARDIQGDYGVIGGPHPSENIADDGSDIASPSPGDAWGQIGGFSPPPVVDFKGGSHGDIDLEPEKVWLYVESYENNIQNMHPLIIPRELRAMVKVWLDRLPVSNKAKGALPMAKWVALTPVGPEASDGGLKRKRSPAAEVADPTTPVPKPGRLFRNIDTALILLVLALGKVCLHKDKLPDVVQESDYARPAPVRNGHPASPSQGSPPSTSPGFPSPIAQDRPLPNRRQSQGHGTLPAPKPSVGLRRNKDSIPGLDYAAIATDILGNHVGGKTLKHVWAYLLAGLYFGQLERPLTSGEYIVNAGRTMISILRP